jgi:hypothetical protein
MMPPVNSALLKYYYILTELSMSQINILFVNIFIVNETSVNVICSNLTFTP